MIEILKKQWFVVLVALILVSFLTFSVWDTNKGKLPGKSADGKDVVASLSDTNILADDVFAKVNEQNGDAMLFMRFQDAVASQAIESSADIKSEAKLQADSIEQQFKASDPTNYKTLINQQLKGIGYSDLEDYCLKSTKTAKLQTNYLDEHLEEYFTPIYEEKNSRIVSHILIKMVDSANPTEEELAKVKSVEDALAAGTSFEDVAIEFSEDSSATNGGSIGYVDSDSGLVEDFKTTALELEKDEVSEWVKVASTNYQGWHMIKVTETDKTAIMENEDIKTGLYSTILTSNENLNKKIVWEASQKLTVEFANDDVKKQLLDYMGIKE